MNPSHDIVIQKNYKYLVEHLDFSHVRDHLIQGSIINCDICEEIEAEKTRAKRNRKFLDIFLKRGPHAFTSFIKALNESGNEFIAEHLEECLTNLEQSESSGQDVRHPPDAASVAASSMQTLALSDTDVETPVASDSTAGTSTHVSSDESTKSNQRLSDFSATTFESLKKKEAIKKKTSCDRRSCAGKPPTSHCVECDMTLCQDCMEIHNEFHHKHYIFNIFKIDSLSDNVFYRKASDFCKKHEREIYKIFCVPCNEIICGDCALTSHSGNDHHRVNLAQMVSVWRQEFTDYQIDIQHAQNELHEQMKNITSSIIHEKKKLNELIIKINESQVKLIETIDEYFKEIKRRLTTKSEGTQDILNQRKAEIEHKLIFVNNLLGDYGNVIDFSASTELHSSLEKLKGIIADDKQSEKSSNVPLECATYTAGKIDNELIKTLAGDVIESSLDYYLTDTGILEVSRIQQVAVDVTVMASGNVVVCDSAAAVLYNHLVHKLCTLPRPPDVTPWTPYYVASSADRIFVSNIDGGDIVEYSARGDFVRVLLRGLVRPSSLAVCQDKLVISCWDGQPSTLHVYDIGDKTHGFWMPRMIPTEYIKLIKKHTVKSLSSVYYVTINETNGDLVISHKGGVMAVDTDSAARWSYPCTDSGPGRLREPWGVATSAGGDVFVTDRDSGRVLRLTQHGQFKCAYQMPRRDGLQLCGVCINDQYVIVLDYRKSQLYKFRY